MLKSSLFKYINIYLTTNLIDYSKLLLKIKLIVEKFA